MTDSESGYGIAFTYANGKVASYQEKSGSSTGASVTVTYPSHTQAVYRDHGADRTANTADDILTYYLFDYAGRTANAYTTDNSGNVLGATNAAYSSSGSTDKTNNRTLRSASIGIAGQQLLRDTSLEASTQWTISGACLSVANPRTGSLAVEGTLEGSGTQSVYRSSESLAAGTTYTFSGYVNTSEATSFVGSGVYLKVTDGSGNSWTSNPVNYATASTVDNGWVRVSVSFTAKSSGAHTVGVYFDGAVGPCYADDFQLEKGEAPSSHNLVENGSMQMSSYGWTMGTGAGIDASKGAAGSSASLKISGDPESASANAYQDIPLNLPGSQTYVLSGWVYANAVPDSDPSSATGTSKKCGLRATITYSDGGTEAPYASFNSDLSKSWQFTSMTIVPKQSGKTVASIRVTCAYEGNANTAYFDNISLLREAAQTMKYDSDGNLVSVNSPGLKEDTNTYSGGNLIKTVTGGNGTYTYTYDTTYTHRLKSVSNGQITQSMGYDGTGNVTSTTLSGSGEKSIQTSASYTGNGNRLASVTDAAGASVTYGYGDANSQMMGLPTSVTDSYGTVTTSAYDASGRVTQTSVADCANLLYTYSSGNLSAVKRTSSGNSAQTYGFTYDSFGNMLTARVGNKTLAAYTYGAGNGLLTKQTYANGDSVSFTYDSLGRTKTATYADGRTLTYTYNGEGRLHSVTEEGGGSSPVTYLYTYDSLGRLISSEQKEGATSTLRTSQTYNENNQLTKQAWQMGSAAYAEDYTYNTSDGSLNTMTTGVGTTLTMGYDGLRRLTSVTGGPVTRQYTYRDISGTQTTMQVASVTSGDYTYGYTYDAMGNIATYTAPGQNPVTYTYDDQGQLLSATGNDSYSYTYDTVGNILTASRGSSTHSYTYGNTDWKDLLTAFDGEAITYDASGNPLSYYNGTRWAFTWSNGRWLTQASASGTTVDYTYNLDGLRTNKTVDGVAHNYLYAGGKLMRETYGSNTLDFFYDANGIPYALKYNGAVYYYITNLQGDVTYLVDANGTAAATYEYDPYGNIITATGTLAQINPLRYRGYYYDNETGLYYLQSRYYDPAVGRFINGDGYASTGQGIIGYNMYAYCNNNPVLYTDSAGCYPLQTAFEFLDRWLTGDGSKQEFTDRDQLTRKIKKSSQMQNAITEAVKQYQDGQMSASGTLNFTPDNGGYELYLGIQHCLYTINVTTETKTTGFWFWKQEKKRYVATVVISDTYDFDEIRDWNSLGSIANNLAYIYHLLGGGHNYEWTATFTQVTKWEKSP